MGLDLGLERAGLTTAVAVEVNPKAAETIRLNKPDLPVIVGQIEGVSSKDILRLARLKRGGPCIVTGGPCCQSFSTAGKRKSISAPSGGLFRHFTRVVADTRPRFFVMENVKGILSAAARHRPLNGRGPGNPPLAPDEELGSALEIILEELSELNYRVVYGLLNCADYGVPQKRMRVIFLGSRDGEAIHLPVPTHSRDGADGKLPWVTLGESIGKLQDPDLECVEFTEDRLKLLRQLKAGQNWTHLPAKLHREALGAAYDSWGGRCGFCRRLAWNKPAPTLTTSPIGRATTLCHPTELRPLSIREYATLQQFPDDWRFSGSVQQKYIQIGNAVPIGLGAAIGNMFRQVMESTASDGLPKNAKVSLGEVKCGDPALEERLANRPKTQLHPARLLKSRDPEAKRKWLESVAA